MMQLFKKVSISLALSMSLFSLAHADANQTITSTGTDQYAWVNSGNFEIGRVTLDQGTQSITALDTSVTLVDQGWGGQDPTNGVYVELLSNNQAVYGIHVAGAVHNWQTQTFDLASNPSVYTGLNAALAGINRNNGPIQVEFVTNAWIYRGWELHTANDSMSVTTSMLPVPEPETYAMLMLGLGLIGFIKSRKNKKVV